MTDVLTKPDQSPEEVPDNTIPPCSDCGFEVSRMSLEPLRRGNTVREPGEALCGSCSAKRTKMVREVDKIPNNLTMIRALRVGRKIRY